MKSGEYGGSVRGGEETGPKEAAFGFCKS